jgi:hypothetical protein
VDDGSRQPPWIPRPFSTKNEYIASEALRLMEVPADVLRQVRPPMLIDPFPQVMGYDTTPLTIEQVLQTDRWAPKQRSFTSGIATSPRHADLQEDMWSGTARNVVSTPNPAG